MKSRNFRVWVFQFTTIYAALTLVGACQPDTQSRSPSDIQEATSPPSVLSLIADEKLRDYIATLATAASSPDSGANAIGRLAMAYDANGFDLAAETTYRIATDNDPREFKWLYLLALRQHKNGDLQSAIANANRAIEINNTYSGIYVRLGSWLLDSGEPIAARAAFRRAVDLGAGPAAELGIVRTLLKTLNHTTALQELDSIVSRTNHPVAFRLLSDAWRAIGDETKSREYLPFASQTKSMWFDDPMVNEMRTHARGKSKRLHDIELMLGSGLVDDALLALEQFDVQERSDFNVQYHFALAYFQKRVFDVARDHLIRAIELEPVHYPSHLLLASLYQHHEENRKAAVHLEQVVKIYPKLSIAHQELGFVMLRIGDTDGALESFRAAIDLDSTSPNVHYYAGVILGARGACDAAVGHFESTLALDQNHDKARMGISECVRALSATNPAGEDSPNEKASLENGAND